MTSQYFLTQHMHPCIVDDLVVLLDLRNDKYMGLEGSKARIFQSLLKLEKSSMSKTEQGNERDSAEIENITAELIKKGILTTDPNNGKEVNFPHIKSPLLDLTGYDVTKKRRVKLDHVFHLVIAAVSTSLMLRMSTLENEIHYLEQRKRRNLENPTTGCPVDKDRVRELVEIFRLTRAFLFTSENYCLYDSIVLIKFLARYGIYPDLVVGVKMRPFQAHAWVQDEEFIYNCSVHDIDLMTPIMVI